MIDPFLSIGGVGGSGTRIVAEYAQDCGVWMGSDLNMALDNHYFGLVIKRPNWMRANWSNPAEIDDRIRIFQKFTSTSEPMSAAERKLVMTGLWEIGVIYHGIADRFPSPKYVAKRIGALTKRGGQVPADMQKWGWKEPNTHMVLHRLIELFPEMKYVHVLRHGFDMAFSGNQQQVDNWSGLFDMPAVDGPALAYKYWVKANRRAMELGAKMGPEKFMAIKFEDLCAEPEKVTRQFIDFLGADVDPDTFAKMISIPKTPRSVGRYKVEDLSCFSDQDVADLEEFGYSVAEKPVSA